MLSSFLTFLLFCIALSADTFTAGLSYGSSGVRIPAPSKLILALVSGLMFTLSVFFSVFYVDSQNIVSLQNGMQAVESAIAG